jgi:hypothetical protein
VKCIVRPLLAILEFLPHKHDELKQEKLGFEMVVCHSMNKILKIWFRPTPDHKWELLPDWETTQKVVKAKSLEEAMALIRKAST